MKHDKNYQLLVQMSEDIGHLKGTSEATLDQARKTNGRILRAEQKIEELQSFRTHITTKMKTYGAIGGVILALVSSFITRIL